VSETALMFAWLGEDAPRMEVARVQLRPREFVADGTQLGPTYELRYRLSADVLELELIGERALEVDLGDADFFDVGYSPLFTTPGW
jgi:hypothetical protein